MSIVLLVGCWSHNLSLVRREDGSGFGKRMGLILCGVMLTQPKQHSFIQPCQSQHCPVFTITLSSLSTLLSLVSGRYCIVTWPTNDLTKLRITWCQTGVTAKFGHKSVNRHKYSLSSFGHTWTSLYPLLSFSLKYAQISQATNHFEQSVLNLAYQVRSKFLNNLPTWMFVRLVG